MQQRGKGNLRGVHNALKELFSEDRGMTLSDDERACKGMLLVHSGTGKVKHLSTKQLWSQGTMQSYGAEVQQVLAPSMPLTCCRAQWRSWH